MPPISREIAWCAGSKYSPISPADLPGRWIGVTGRFLAVAVGEGRVEEGKLQTRCPFTSLVISNIETTFLPSNTASSFSSARMLRFSLGSWSSCFRMYSQSFLISSVRGSGSLPTTTASAVSGCTGLLKAFLEAADFFGVGIGQLERAGLGCQAKNQPCFKGSLARPSES